MSGSGGTTMPFGATGMPFRIATVCWAVTGTATHSSDASAAHETVERMRLPRSKLVVVSPNDLTPRGRDCPPRREAPQLVQHGQEGFRGLVPTRGSCQDAQQSCASKP